MSDPHPMTSDEAKHYGESFAGRMEEIERKAAALGDPGLTAQLDHARAHADYMRNVALSRLLGD